MLNANGADWCHGALRWSEPRVVRQLDEITGFNKHRAKYSAFVFARGEALRPGVRIVRDVEKTHRGGEGAGCGPGFYGPLILPKRNRTDENRTFQKLTAFERIEVSPAPVDGVIGPTAAVTICS